jgi:GDP-4-dehydro-6-deoxy-D-mannose reductase
MRVLVTGADGFVGRWLCRALLGRGHGVIAAVKRVPGANVESDGLPRIALELTDPASYSNLECHPADAVVHLAAVASGAEARADPAAAWEVNAVGTARLVEELARLRRAGACDPLVLVASTGEVYGRAAARPSHETDPPAPCSPYAASKLGAELAALETAGRTGLRVIVVRPFAQFGPGQDERFFVPAMVARLATARRVGARVVKVGNLEPVRDFLDVRDAVEALLALLEQGQPGEVYNVATGQGIRLLDLFHRIASLVGVNAMPEADPELMRTADIPYLVGDASKLRGAAGWSPRIALEQTLADIVAAREAV